MRIFSFFLETYFNYKKKGNEFIRFSTTKLKNEEKKKKMDIVFKSTHVDFNKNHTETSIDECIKITNFLSKIRSNRRLRLRTRGWLGRSWDDVPHHSSTRKNVQHGNGDGQMMGVRSNRIIK